ncbi:xylose isomerase [Sphingomonas piscis]|uniref:Xylose isomerase n=1 Tax=Sphingomonas piscis TaxID=2714943 RepID=A0A6G7YN69_9SPHN|nr:xylose isomerase [Sphingomonas piscis]QIK78188.1 xylose isomerase [Sphingomonas piscis]
MTDRVFADIEPIKYEGPDSDNMLAYRYYDPKRQVLGKSMEEHLRLAVCYWHSFAWPGADIFGAGTFERPWMPAQACTEDMAEIKLQNAFDFFERLGAPFFCFHDVDAMAVANTTQEHQRNLAAIADAMQKRMETGGTKLLWGTANLFSHPRYAAGAATSPDPDIYAWAAFQVREMLETTHRLGGANYVLWGGREGYDSILNTKLGQELDQLGRFLNMVVEHKHKIGFTGKILIEPKPHEPAKHQYDRDTATVYGFLERYGLIGEVFVNIEANHATLAGNSFEHEIATAVALGVFGSIDINRGDPQNGWDTDQFPNDVPGLTLALLEILKGGGFDTGGFNFDSKVRRQSIDPVDLYYGHIGGIDVLAKALLNAAALIEDGRLQKFADERYAGWQGEFGQKALKSATLAELADHALQANSTKRPSSGRQEYLENLINRFV